MIAAVVMEDLGRSGDIAVVAISILLGGDSGGGGGRGSGDKIGGTSGCCTVFAAADCGEREGKGVASTDKLQIAADTRIRSRFSCEAQRNTRSDAPADNWCSCIKMCTRVNGRSGKLSEILKQ